VSGVAVYIIIWWLVIFLVLPWGVQTVSAEDVARGHAPSAPRRPRIRLKAAVTTLVAAVLWLIVYAVIESGVISFVEN
jgi:predicted secreted protein